jgi:hypothetical protein
VRCFVGASLAERCTVSASRKSFFCPFEYEPSIVSKHAQLATEMMAPTQASMPIKHGGRLASRVSHLHAGPLLPQDDCPALIVAHHVKGVLADIDTDHGESQN